MTISQVVPVKQIPHPTAGISLKAMHALRNERGLMAALETFHAQLGNVFQFQLPGFQPVALIGAEANEFVLLTEHQHLRWRSESDPIARLLGHGLLVEDGTMHSMHRQLMSPALHMSVMESYLASMWRCIDQVIDRWQTSSKVDMLKEMRRISLLIVFDALFKDDFSPQLSNLWSATLNLMRFISPGIWMMWSGAPSPGYEHARRKFDTYLHEVIARRRTSITENSHDLLGLLLNSGYDDTLIRDEMMTMVVAGHDTTTALLTWIWYSLGKHQDVYTQIRHQVRNILGDGQPGDIPPTMEQVKKLDKLDHVVKETLRLYPPAHLGSRIATQPLEFQGYIIPEGSRVIYSIYLTHRMAEYWPNPAQFTPDRWIEFRPRKFTYLPFGGGPRLCIGAAFGEIQAKLTIARVLQRYDVALLSEKVRMHMGATIEPRQGRNGLLMRVSASR